MRQQPTRTLFNAIAFTAGLVGGVVGFITGGSRFSRWRPSRVKRKSRYALAATEIEPSLARRSGGFQTLRSLIFGCSKQAVADALGPPPAAALSSSIPGAGGGQAGFWAADTWYYPFDSARHAAIAVFFDADRVVRVEFLGGAR
jgi:hypothetical protein